jgi:hypothetical protein
MRVRLTSRNFSKLPRTDPGESPTGRPRRFQTTVDGSGNVTSVTSLLIDLRYSSAAVCSAATPVRALRGERVAPRDDVGAARVQLGVERRAHADGGAAERHVEVHERVRVGLRGGDDEPLRGVRVEDQVGVLLVRLLLGGDELAEAQRHLGAGLRERLLEGEVERAPRLRARAERLDGLREVLLRLVREGVVGEEPRAVGERRAGAGGEPAVDRRCGW